MKELLIQVELPVICSPASFAKIMTGAIQPTGSECVWLGGKQGRIIAFTKALFFRYGKSNSS